MPLILRSKLTRQLCLAFLCAAGLYGQVSGRLSGSILDPSGAPIPKATVQLFLSGGESAVVAGAANEDGVFVFPSVRPETYDIVIETPGFRKQSVRGVKVTPAQETPIGKIFMALGIVSETIEVTAEVQHIQTSNAEISTTVTNEQLRRLPTLNRSPIALLQTQTGVQTNNRASTTINGMRVSFVNITLDGVNIQDNFLRDNGVDFQPNMLLLDQVAEVNIGTSNNNLSQGGGAAQINFVTPSGSNAYHGSLLWTNRNNALSANSWFNNRDGVARPFLNQNQFGGALGGKIIKDKLFFYGNYEGLRLVQQSTANRTVLTDDARKGIFTYVAGGVAQKVNLLQTAGLTADSAAMALINAMPAASKINNFRVGDSTEGLLRNTAGYSFLVRNNRTRDNITGKLDYYVNSKSSLSGTYSWNRDIVDRPDQSNDYSYVPKVSNTSKPTLLSATWRWSPSASTTNELRGGFNLTQAPFLTSESFPSALASGLLFSNPINTFRAQGRDTNTYNLQDNATTIRGKHNLQYGFQYQLINTTPYNDGGITPTYTLGISTASTFGLNSNQLPGISAADLTTANSLLANVAGLISSASQTFNVTSRDSGFVNGATNIRNFTQANWSGYLQDSWRMNRRLTVVAGLRYEYFTRVDEKNGLFLLPQGLNAGNVRQLLLSNATYDYAGSAVGRPWYSADKNNFAPNVGFSWDLFGTSKTVLRGGYSVSFVNDQNIAALRNNVTTNSGLSSNRTLSGLTSRLSSPTVIPPPSFKVPRTAADNYALDTQGAQGAIDPNLRTPYVNQYSLGIQHDVKDTIIEVRYVGNHAVKQFRAFDLNQVNIGVPGYLDDFKKAYSNGVLAQNAGLGFNPAYNAALSGSQPLPFFTNNLGNGGLLTNATIRSLIQTQQVGDLASTYQVNGLNGSTNFFANPYGLGMNLLANYSHSSYNALQADVRRRMRNGVQLQFNYTYGKVMSDTSGDTQTRFDPFLDANNGSIERARAVFDVTHIIRANGVYELPFGAGHRWTSSNPVISRILSGWNLGATTTRQSGTPFSILSGRGTFNRAARSANNTANTNLTKDQLDQIIGYRMTGVGPYIVASSVMGADGRAVAADGAPAFAGQAFFQPTAGNIGGLQRRYFSGPWNFALDFSVQKVTRLTERQTIELRMDSTNIMNHPTFDVTGDYSITSATFGRLTNTGLGSRRLVQFGLIYRF